MDSLYVHFPVSGVDTWIFIPPLVAFAVSFFTSMGGVSGAFLLLPFQMSVLNYTSPSVSGTNQVFNLVAIPSGVYRYIREGRMVWPLTWCIVAGTLPGVFLGAWMRIVYLPDPGRFKLFAGIVLLYIGARLLLDTKKGRGGRGSRFSPSAQTGVTAAGFSLTRAQYIFANERFSFSPIIVFILCFFVGVIGGIYGIGGGAILAPIFVAVFKLPVYTVAGAALMGTFITSIAGVAFYQILAVHYSAQMSVAPDWILGSLFGLGGFFGMYLGARCQKHVPARVIKSILFTCILFVAIKYIAGFFF